MNKTRLIYPILLFGLGFIVIHHGHTAVGQTVDLDIDDNSRPISISDTRTNSLNISEPVYQAISGNFVNTKELTTIPTLVTEESFLEEAIVQNIGNVTNNITFTNTYDLQSMLIKGRGNGMIETTDGQNIGWISSDIGVLSETGPIFHGIILFNNTNSDKLSFLNGKVGIYKETPEIHRTIWLFN